MNACVGGVCGCGDIEAMAQLLDAAEVRPCGLPRPVNVRVKKRDTGIFTRVGMNPHRAGVATNIRCANNNQSELMRYHQNYAHNSGERIYELTENRRRHSSGGTAGIRTQRPRGRPTAAPAPELRIPGTMHGPLRAARRGIVNAVQERRNTHSARVAVHISASVPAGAPIRRAACFARGDTQARESPAQPDKGAIQAQAGAAAGEAYHAAGHSEEKPLGARKRITGDSEGKDSGRARKGRSR